MPLINVRLSVDDARRAAALRDAGVQVSDVVREAIRAEYLRRRPQALEAGRPSAIVTAILDELPDETEGADERVDTRDRRAVRRQVVAKLRRRR